MENIEDWLRNSNLPSNVHRSILEDLVGKSGLVSCQSDSGFDEILKNVMKKWGHIEKEYIRDSKSKYSNYFIKNKAEKIKPTLRTTSSNIGECIYEYQKQEFENVS